jgi:hypothetical protein
LRLQGISCDDTLPDVLREAGKALGVDTAPLLRIREDPKAAHASYRALLEKAVDAADRLNVGSAA